MEDERSEKLSELNTTLRNLTEDQAKIEMARSIVDEVISEVGDSKDKVKLWQNQYQDHASFLRALNRNSPDMRIQSLKWHVNSLEYMMESFTKKVFSSSKQLRAVSNSLNFIKNELTEKRDLINNAKDSEDLEHILIVRPPLKSSNLPWIAKDRKIQWMAMGLPQKLKEAMEELRKLVEEDRAQKTST